MLIRLAYCVLLFACFVSAAEKPTSAPAQHTVSIKSMKFSPDRIEIRAGDSVIWTNADDRDHTVTAKDGSFKSGNLSKGDTFSHQFTKSGKFNYACSYHPRMKAVVVVSGD